jgi:hypothetical protein
VSLWLLKRRAARGTVLQVVRVPSLLWCLVAGASGGLEAAELSARGMERRELWLQDLVIVSVTVTATNLLVLPFDGYAPRYTPHPLSRASARRRPASRS